MRIAWESLFTGTYDPVNALLSLTYTMIFNEISSLLDGLGFDPYLSYYHSVDYGRASLGSDLIEEFRAPIADRFVLNCLNNNVFGKEDFYANPKDGAIYLRRESLKRYFAEYEEMINRSFTHSVTKENTSYRKCFLIQAESLAVCINDKGAYVSFKQEQ